MKILLKQLENEIKWGTDYSIECKFNKILIEIAKKHEPKLFKKISKLVENQDILPD